MLYFRKIASEKARETWPGLNRAGLSVPTALDQYRSAKSDYLKLRSQARKELISRFHELANELLRIQGELLEDFGEKVQLPSKPKRLKAKPAAVVAGRAKDSSTPIEAAPKVAAIQKRLDVQKKKLADLKSSGKPTKPVEDRIYELEDELRLAQS